jgi:hypothetical protein
MSSRRIIATYLTHAPGTPLDGLELVFKGEQAEKVDLFEGVRRGKP